MNRAKNVRPDTHLMVLVSVFDALEAELIRNTLKEHGIACSLEGEHQAGFTGTLQIGILVREEDLDAGLRIIKKHHPHLL